MRSLLDGLSMNPDLKSDDQGLRPEEAGSQQGRRVHQWRPEIRTSGCNRGGLSSQQSDVDSVVSSNTKKKVVMKRKG